ncbi:MAG: hypothetical protein HQL90_00060 [Magnetococcales bacterium]|nr:hypothetical protein [Magnetococcales bacterium]
MSGSEVAGKEKPNLPYQNAKKKCPTCKKGTPLWFISWADMVTLLLCLFVIIVAYSTQDMGKFQTVAGSMKDSFGGNSQAKSKRPTPMGYNPVGMQFQRPIQLGRLAEQVRVVLLPLIDEGQANAFQDPTGIVLQINRDAIFQTNTETLNSSSQLMLADFVAIVKNLPNTLEIRSIPASVPGKPFNWSAGEEETIAIANFFEQQGDISNDRIRATTLPVVARGDDQMEKKRPTKDKIEIRVIATDK